MYLLNRAIVGIVMCCIFASSASAESKDESNKNPVGPAISPSPENDRKVEDLLVTTLRARQKRVYALLDQFKATYHIAWRCDKDVRIGYDKLENRRPSREDVFKLSHSVLHTLVALPYRHPLEDNELFQAVLGMCFHTNEQSANKFMTWLAAFADVPESNIESLMPVLMSNPQSRPLLRIPVSGALRKRYRTFFQGQVEREKREYDKLFKAGKATVSHQIIHLSRCAQLGDEVSSRRLIALYGQLKWDGEDGGRDARLAMRQLLEIGGRDCMIAVLERFRENVGSPEYRPGSSPRSEILGALMWKFPKDVFFKPYHDFLASPISETILDSAIGGVAGVKKLYAGLQVWVRERYNYKLDLDDAEPKIKATPPVRKYFKTEK